jgi:hypothetical protein
MIHWFSLSMMCSVLQRKRTWTSERNDTIAAARHEGVERLSRPHIGAGSAPPTKRDEASFQVRLANGGGGPESAVPGRLGGGHGCALATRCGDGRCMTMRIGRGTELLANGVADEVA